MFTTVHTIVIFLCLCCLLYVSSYSRHNLAVKSSFDKNNIYRQRGSMSMINSITVPSFPQLEKQSGSCSCRPEVRRHGIHRNSWVMAASSGRGGGATKLDRKTSQQTSTKPTYKEEIEKDWRLILHDDNVHTIQQVCEILGACCPLCAGPRAYEVTLEVHMTGAGTVAVANKKVVSEYSKSLQAAGLTVSMAPDDDFEGSDDDDE